MDYGFLWGVIALACGTVMIVYGASMFRVVLALFLTSLIGVGSSWFLSLLAAGGAVLGAFGGRYLGQWLTIVSSAFAGAYFSVTGLALIFGQTAPNGMMPVNLQTLVVFVLLATISFLAQARTRNLRRNGAFVR